MHIEDLAKKMREDALAKLTPSVRRVEELRQQARRLEKIQSQIFDLQMRELEKLYYHAGRYSGGSRDKAAIDAWQRLNRKETVDNE